MTHRQAPASRARHAERPPARPRRLGGLVLATAAVALLGGCCGCGLPTQATNGGNGGNGAGSTTATPTRQAALTVQALDGRPIQIPSGRPTVLYFFSAGCRQCVSGARTLVQARKQTGPAATFLAVDLDPPSPPRSSASSPPWRATRTFPPPPTATPPSAAATRSPRSAP